MQSAMGWTVWGMALAAVVLWPGAEAAAQIYKYQSDDGEIVLTTQARSDLKLLEVIGQTRPSTQRDRPAGGGASQSTSRRDQSAFDPIIREASEAYAIPFAFIKAVIKIESNFDPNAVSRVGAMGLMQLMPGTAGDMGVVDAFDPRENIFGGTKYLRMLSDRYNGDINLVLSGYHAGPGNVDKYSGIPFAATRDYVQNVYTWYKRYQAAEGESAAGEVP